MIRVLSVADFFLPGFKAGGPVRTLLNMSRILHGAVAFGFLTRDHDLGDGRPYEGIHVGRWEEYPHGQVYYAPNRAFGRLALERSLSTGDFDVIYLNSFFSLKGSIAIVWRNWRRSFGLPLLLAPRGEFSPGALALKGGRKRFFIWLSRKLGMYRLVYWHASTEDEKNDISRQFPDVASRIFVAEDPVDIREKPPLSSAVKTDGLARLAFISRISPKKNLVGLLRILQNVQSAVELEIYGPIEDKEYWKICLASIAKLPAHVLVRHKGELQPEEVGTAFAQADLFAFPTHGENFGHVIFEALQAGTPVLTSDQTPWQSDGTNAVARLPLGALEEWRAYIETVAQLSESEQKARRADALRYAERYAASEKTRLDNLRMFQEIAKQNKMKVIK